MRGFATCEEATTARGGERKREGEGEGEGEGEEERQERSALSFTPLHYRKYLYSYNVANRGFVSAISSRPFLF